MKKPLTLAWDLDVIFPGGSASDEFSDHLSSVSANIQSLGAQVAALTPTSDAQQWSEVIEANQGLHSQLRTASAFISCLNAQDVKDTQAKLLQGSFSQMHATYLSVMTQLDQKTLDVPADVWEALFSDARLEPVKFPLEERRRRAIEKLSAEMESLVNDLSVDGYHAWSSLYNAIIGRMTITVEKDGQPAALSIGQAQNRYQGHEDRAVRQDAFQKWEAAFTEQEELISSTLNHLGGYRLQLYKHRGWESVHQDPLELNRMSQATLDVMWNVINENREPFVRYLNRKAQLLGVEQLAWFDVHAPLGESTTTLSYDEGAQFIVDQFHKFSPQMAEFAVKAFEERWIEAEDRPGKRPGGFCTGFPKNGQSRIFMTYDGSTGAVATLAHELGHAYHSYVMKDLPPMVQSYSMNVAETASTFAEMIVADAALKNSKSEEEHIALLDNKLGNAVSFFMDIQSRFIFETNFYTERKKGLVSSERLNELMTNAQKEAFSDALSEYHPHFWASKLHFYSTGVPFYNFPYTFGYLFSYGVYARALQEGDSFAEKYVALLRDTGRMRVEELAQKHLGVDLTQPDFWQAAVSLAVRDAEEFLRLTNNKVHA
ncbi:M3 family oligoendopeptidase [Tumebacillus permanentifrigoris]|uniref:PepF/M3 family oligoendopeptidase n=1 Tax=Tumebacillus permanentifrigoris TaxID=378543 RepID=A0A316D682_9BACL|nr:M3 family oligoendopeptidase [Tumebacillus permanentifrigoris]PWK09044.1 pepF/M3 family oligoendopeptidase [Tumebacillus permanentifrigoris]